VIIIFKIHRLLKANYIYGGDSFMIFVSHTIWAVLFFCKKKQDIDKKNHLKSIIKLAYVEGKRVLQMKIVKKLEKFA
jgi:protein-disulfide isomerase-like protein with CxxC motif